MEIIINTPGLYLHIQDAVIFVQYCIDGIINIQDLLIIIGFILDVNELNHLDIWLSDFDQNQTVNVQDIILIVDRILRN